MASNVDVSNLMAIYVRMDVHRAVYNCVDYDVLSEVIEINNHCDVLRYVVLEEIDERIAYYGV